MPTSGWCLPGSWTTWPRPSGLRSCRSIVCPGASMRVPCASSSPGGRTPSLPQCREHTRSSWTRRGEPRGRRAHAPAGLSRRRRGSQWGRLAAHVWHLTEFVDAEPVARLTPSLVDQLMEIVELQAGEASEPYDHWSYAWRVATGHEPVLAWLSGYSSAVSAVIERVPACVCRRCTALRRPDMPMPIQPSNVLVLADGAVVALAGSTSGNAGQRHPGTDLVTLQRHYLRARAGGRPRAVVGAHPRCGRLGRGHRARGDPDPPAARVARPVGAPGGRRRGGARSHRALDELEALR